MLLRATSRIPSMLAVVLIAVLFGFLPKPLGAQSACDTLSFAAGTQWTLCWELRQREGLVIRTADYRDRDGVARRVLYRGSVAEVHVPYHDGSPRFLDVTASTNGLGFHALELESAECDGFLFDNKVCRETHRHGYAWKWSGEYELGQEVTYWSSSQLGQYNYITSWTFRDDGSFEPGLAFTGRLQVVRSGPAFAAFGTRVNPQSAATGQFGINHMHNVYWRLDLDIALSANDAVDRMAQSRHTGPGPLPGVNCSVSGTCHVTTFTRLSREVAERIAAFRTWHQIDRGTLNADGRPIGFELVPSGSRWTGPTTEPWAAHEFYLTRYNGCELFAVNNNNTSVNPGCGGAAPDVRAMVNGEAVDGADVVLWYNLHLEHVVRDEDQVNMPIEHIGFELHPRSWRHVNTLQ